MKAESDKNDVFKRDGRKEQHCPFSRRERAERRESFFQKRPTEVGGDSLASHEASQWGDCAGSQEDSVNGAVMQSFEEQDGRRGVHFFDGEECDFVTWDLVLEYCNKMMDSSNPAHVEFEEKLIHTMSNIKPDSEFVLCQQTGSVVTIECYRAES